MKTSISGKDYYPINCFTDQGITAAFSGSRWRMRYGEPAPAKENDDRQSFLAAAGIQPEHIVRLDQVHGTNIAVLLKKTRRIGTQAREAVIGKTDAAITDIPGVLLSVLSADCVPLFFYDSENQTVGIAHLGWRGALQKLAEKIVRTFQDQFHTNPVKLQTAIGPAIRSCCYEVGPEFQEKFPVGVTCRNNRFYCDLPAIISRGLQAAGVLVSNIIDTEWCTVCNVRRFHSYRRDGSHAGRIWSVIMIPRELPSPK